jgi:hypothetical protein
MTSGGDLGIVDDEALRESKNEALRESASGVDRDASDGWR